MTAQGTYAPDPAAQYDDGNGFPAVNYRLFTYLAGTSTKVSTFTDIGLGSANANPLTLGSDARPTVMLTPGVSYKFVLALPGTDDPPASVLWTRDNITAVPPPGSATDTDITGTAGENIATNDAVYLSDGSGGKTAGRWYRTDATQTYASVAAWELGFAPVAITSGATGSIRITGRITGMSGLIAGSVYYLANTVGTIDAAGGTNQRPIGMADSATTFVVAPWVATFRPAFGFAPIYRAGLATTFAATASGVIFADHAQANGATGAGTDCLSTTIAGGTISGSFKMIRLTAFGTFAANANNKTMTFTFGGTATLTFPTVALNNYQWKLVIELFRTTATNAHTQQYTLTLTPAAGGGTGVVYGARAAGSKDLTADQTIKITIISGTASGDITFDAGYIEVVG